ncbi:hypothetical protein HHK36_017048 [Tetracentron sinense]|uniref:3'-5' exonuclease domain-containing protein n=1 Tax=Tetracentron sinense TaxID=13715 RepID=A0A834Z4H4_TETSI|nr:hypothetical protein HHK36_017048 [Tetracentron sinense]
MLTKALADFSGYKIEYPAVTIQICVGCNCLIFQSYHARRVPRCLFKYLSNPNYTFTSVAISDDAKKLLMDYRLVVMNILDLHDLAVWVLGEQMYKMMGLKSLTKVVLGKEFEKRGKSIGFGLIYDFVENAKKYEPKYKLIRNVLDIKVEKSDERTEEHN